MDSERSIEVTGDDVEAAIAAGLEQLGVGPTEVIVEVLEEPSRGMFGLKSRPARVRLQLLVSQSGPVETPTPAPPPTPKPAEAQRSYPEEDMDDDEDEFFSDDVEIYDGPLDEDAEVGRVVLTELLEKMSVRAQIEIRRAESGEGSDDEAPPPWLLDVAGSGDLSTLIGRRGETLASLQYITRLITSRELQRRANIIVDVAGYKRRRTMKLNDLARRMADQAIDQQRTITLEPMPPYERRIVHLALRDREDVQTQSVGEGQARKVTIVPR